MASYPFVWLLLDCKLADNLNIASHHNYASIGSHHAIAAHSPCVADVLAGFCANHAGDRPGRHTRNSQFECPDLGGMFKRLPDEQSGVRGSSGVNPANLDECVFGYQCLGRKRLPD
jgi:hypothetical protein